MTLPSLAIGLVIALLIGALFHIWLDGGGGRLILYLILSLVGFFAGQLAGSLLNWSFLPLGPLDLGMAIAGSLVFLGVGHWLSLIEIQRPGGRDRL
jgi:hypothetical protein